MTKQCSSSGCKKCKHIYHTLLHFSSQSSHTNTQITSNNNGEVKTTLLEHDTMANTLHANNTLTLTSSDTFTNQVLLSTAIVKVCDYSNKLHTCRVLLDNGSQSNFISERLCNLLKLPSEKLSFCVSGIDQKALQINERVQVHIYSSNSKYQTRLSCLSIPDHIVLGEPDFNCSGPIDLLIGADLLWELLNIGQIQLGKGLPILQKTQLEWIVSAPLKTNTSSTNHVTCYFSNTLESQLERFWKHEEIHTSKLLSPEEAYCEQHFMKHITRADDGKFTARLPLKCSSDKLGDSKVNALQRFYKLESKHEKNPDLKRQYHNIVK
ncbi:hypothetical protein YQE_08949, partial [Dendroctonus ponderosae]